jgi:hypothetical protein
MTRGDRSDPPFDASRLDPEELALWKEHFSDPSPNEAEVVRVWGFAHACMLELSGPPEVVGEWLRRHDTNSLVAKYLENLRTNRA